MVQGNVTDANSVDYVSGYIMSVVSIIIGIIVVLCIVYSTYEKEMRKMFLNCGCTICLPNKIHPDGTVGTEGIRLPTSGERIIALGILAKSPSGTTIRGILDEIVKGSPRNGDKNTLETIEPEWKKQKKQVTYDLESGTITSAS